MPRQRVAFGTSGHRGSAFDKTFNEWHVLAISQAIRQYRKLGGIDGPLFLGIDTQALSEPAGASALEVLAATREQKKLLAKLSPQQVTLTELAGERIQAVLTRAPGNDAPIGGVKVIAESGWFAARPSGTEDIYKIYGESFRGVDHLHRILEEAQTIVNDALAAGATPE